MEMSHSDQMTSKYGKYGPKESNDKYVIIIDCKNSPELRYLTGTERLQFDPASMLRAEASFLSCLWHLSSRPEISKITTVP